MSNSPIAPTSTTGSSTSSPSPAETRQRPGLVVIACGALAGNVREIAARRGWLVEVQPLPALLHNRPHDIAREAERLAGRALDRGQRAVLAYADCGTYGALDEVCSRLGLARLGGLHCYDVLAGADNMAKLFEAEPGTYVLTDFLVRGFRRAVLAELGLDRYPELWPDYFRHYRRLVWLAQHREPGLEREAQRIAEMFGLPLAVIETGTARLEAALERLVAQAVGRGGPGQDPGRMTRSLAWAAGPARAAGATGPAGADGGAR